MIGGTPSVLLSANLAENHGLDGTGRPKYSTSRRAEPRTVRGSRLDRWPYWSSALSDCTLSAVSGEIQIAKNALNSTMARSANGSDRAAADWRAGSRPPRA